MVAAMTLPNLIERITDGAVLITPGDRADVLLAALFAHASTALPSLAGVVLTGGLRPPEHVLRLARGLRQHAAGRADRARHLRDGDAGRRAREGAISRDAPRKIDTALALFERHVDGDELLDRARRRRSRAVTPLMFEYTLLDRARADPRHIVLPEGTDERVLRAAEILLRRGWSSSRCSATEAEVRGAAVAARLDLDGAHVLDPRDPELLERFAQEYAQRRAHKGVTVDQARDVVTDVSYFGTLMVALGMADGMVSGADAHDGGDDPAGVRAGQDAPGRLDRLQRVPHVPRRPRARLRRLRRQPGADAPSSWPTSRSPRPRTAAQFGIEPRVAMLSYSTGTSGAGAEVERVRAATELVRSRAPGALGRGADPVRRRRRRRRGARPSCRAARSRGARRCSSSPTSTRATTPTRPCSAAPARSPIGPVLQGLQQAGQRPLARRDRPRHRQHRRDHGDPGQRSA